MSGLDHYTGNSLGDGAGDHARAGSTWLTGVHPKKTEGADIRVGISADQIAAKELGKQTVLPSLELGLEDEMLQIARTKHELNLEIVALKERNRALERMLETNAWITEKSAVMKELSRKLSDRETT